MNVVYENFWASLSEFLIFFVVSAVLVILFVLIYTRITRHNEIALIKQNSTAASVAFSGSLIGFALPLASTIINSLTVIELMLWGGGLL